MKSNNQAKVVFDFDGTITDAVRESKAYITAHHRFIVKQTDIPLTKLKHYSTIAKKKILHHPHLYGWKYQTRIVAPPADPVLFNQAIIRTALNLLRTASPTYHIPPEGQLMDQLIEQAHKYAYPHSTTAFKPGAKQCIEKLHRANKLVIVTNSDTDKVRYKLSLLLKHSTLNPNDITLYGNAKRNIIAPHWTKIPHSTKLPGLKRPALLRRKHYYHILTRIGLANIDYVVGDNGELDLLLPFVLTQQNPSLNIKTILILTDYTPSWEKSFWNYPPQRQTLPSLTAITRQIFN